MMRSGGLVKEEEDQERQLLKELQSLSRALNRAGPPASPMEAPPDASKKKQPREGGYPRQQMEVMNSRALLQERKSRGVWSWRPLRALSHLGKQPFPCLFIAHVHSIRNLPPCMAGLRLKVQFSQRNGQAQTLPCRVSEGSAEIDEAVSIKCTVYGWSSKSSQGIKYLPKRLILSVVAVDLNDLEVGRHQLDLTQMLPERHHEGCGKKDVDRTTRFYLSGKASGGMLMVSFGYEILGNQFRHAAVGDDDHGRESKARIRNASNMVAPADTDFFVPRVSDPPIDHQRRVRPISMEDVRNFEGKARSNSLQSFSQSGVSDSVFWRFKSQPKRDGGVDTLHMGDSEITASKTRAQDSDLIHEDSLDYATGNYGVEIRKIANKVVHLRPTLQELEMSKQTDVMVADKHPLPSFPPSVKERDAGADGVMKREETRECRLTDPSPNNVNYLEKFEGENSCGDHPHAAGFDMLPSLGEKKKMDLIDGETGDTISAAGAADIGSDYEDKLIEGNFLQMLEEEHQFHQQDPPKFLQGKRTGSKALSNEAPSLDPATSPLADFFRVDDDLQKLSSSISGANPLLPGEPTDGKNQGPVTCTNEDGSWLRKSYQKACSKIRAKLLEDAEMEELMHKWGVAVFKN